MRRGRGSALATLAVLAALACTSSDPSDGVQYFGLAYSDFRAAEPLAVSAPMTVVIRDQASWSSFWTTHGPFGQPAPVVDFNQDMLIGVFWGAGYTGCSAWADGVDRVRLRIDGINTLGVIEVEIGPLGGLGSCATPVMPLQVLVIDTTATQVQFVGMVPS